MHASTVSNTDTPAASRAGEALLLDSAAVRIAAKLKGELLLLLEDEGTPRIDGSAVERIDTATLQVLAAFSRDLLAGSRAVQWCGQSAVLERAANALGLAAALGLTTGNA